MMIHIRTTIPMLIAGLGIAGSLALFWLTRSAPLALPPVFYLDATGTFFSLAVWLGVATQERRDWRLLLAALLLTCAMTMALTPLIPAIYLLLALLAGSDAVRWRDRLRIAAMPLLAALALALGYGLLAWRGAFLLSAPDAGAALDSLVFWWVVLAATLPLLPLRQLRESQAQPVSAMFAFAWLYPLTRLYTLGPWNEGWSFATLTLGGVLLLRMAFGAFTAPSPAERQAHARQRFLAMALAGIGLSSGAGVAAAWFAILVFLLLSALESTPSGEATGEEPPVAPSVLPPALAAWLCSGAIPLTAPFVAAWMLVGAGVAGGVSLLAAAAWFAALLGALPVALSPPVVMSRRGWIVAGFSLALGVTAPLVARLLAQPAIEQLQSGLSVHGDISIWPWLGLAASNSARTGITALPTIGIAGLMLTLSAILYLLARWFQPQPADESPAPMSYTDMVAEIRRMVPWLGESSTKAPDHDHR